MVQETQRRQPPRPADPTHRAAPHQRPAAPYQRPAPPDRGPGQQLRVLAGAREEILEWIPAMRPYYTGLGSIVLATSCLAALAMFTALTKIVSAPAVVLISIAAFWGGIIFTIDRWLITSAHSITGPGPGGLLRRIGVFAPRLLLATVVALTIAEPVILMVFQPTLSRQVRLTQATDLSSYRSALIRCNPASGAVVDTAQCDSYRLSLPSSPGSVQAQLAAAKAQQALLQPQVNTLQATFARFTQTAEAECAGQTGPNLSGVPGQGPDCYRDQAAAASYRNSSGLDARQRQLTALGKEINTLSAKASSAGASYTSKLSRAIASQVAQRRAGQQGTIGLIDEWQALETLSAKSTFVAFGEWLIRAILAVLDCLPVLAKLMNGSTPYDRRLHDQIASDERIHEHFLRQKEKQFMHRTGSARPPDSSPHPADKVRLAKFIQANPGIRRSAVAARLCEEGLRRFEFPGIEFRSGPAGRRAALHAGPEVWEVVRYYKETRKANRGITTKQNDLLALVARHFKVPVDATRLALAYEARYRAEIDHDVNVANAAATARDQERHAVLT